MPEQPVRDQHGTPLPGTDEPLELRDDQVDEGLAALPGWERAGVVLKRAVPVPRDSRDALAEGVRNVVEDASRLEVQLVDGEFTIILGNGPGALLPSDLETAARIDTVLSGSGTDHGSS